MLSEALSREAAVFASRISTLKSNKMVTSGKVLDKIIDTSRKPVPDPILDEQDKVEARFNGMEGLGKFVMNVVMQWKKYCVCLSVST